MLKNQRIAGMPFHWVGRGSKIFIIEFYPGFQALGKEEADYMIN